MKAVKKQKKNNNNRNDKKKGLLIFIIVLLLLFCIFLIRTCRKPQIYDSMIWQNAIFSGEPHEDNPLHPDMPFIKKNIHPDLAGMLEKTKKEEKTIKPEKSENGGNREKGEKEKKIEKELVQKSPVIKDESVKIDKKDTGDPAVIDRRSPSHPILEIIDSRGNILFRKK